MAKFGACGFCGRTNQVLDREHYIAQRFRRHFPAKPHGHHGQQVHGPNPEYRPLRTAWDNPVGGIGHDCCNDAWMKDLDIRVEPILVHALGTAHLVLSMSDQRALSRWACKVVALSEMTIRPEGRAMNLTDRLWIKNRQTPPQTTRVWITAYEWDGKTHPSLSFGSFTLGTQVQLRERLDWPKNSYTAAIAFAHLALVLYGTKTEIDVTTPDRRVADRVVPIWPSNGRVGWPLLPLLTVSQMVEVAHGIRATLGSLP